MNNDNGGFGKNIIEGYDVMKGVCSYHNEFQLRIAETVRKFFATDEQDTLLVLEVGTGTGGTTKALLDADSRIRIVSVEKELLMVKQAKKNLAKYIESGRLVVEHQDILSYLERDKLILFDAVVQGYCFHNFERKYRLRVLKQISQILSHNGILVNGDKFAQDSVWRDLLINIWILSRFVFWFSTKGRFDLAMDWVFHILHDYRPHLRWYESEAIEQLTQLGFEVQHDSFFRKGVEAIFTAVKL